MRVNPSLILPVYIVVLPLNNIFSCFFRRQVDEILQNAAKYKPVILQNESHPYLHDKDLRDFCAQNGIVFQVGVRASGASSGSGGGGRGGVRGRTSCYYDSCRCGGYNLLSVVLDDIKIKN